MNCEREENLITRVIGRDDGPADWSALRELAREDLSLWRRVADGLEDDMLVRRATEGALVAVGGAEASSVPFPGLQPARGFRVQSWLGFALAAGLAILWLLGAPSPLATGARGIPPAPSTDAGHTAVVVRELPRLIVKTAPTQNGFEVFYLRRVLERAVVRQVEAVHHDELGRPWSTAVRPASLTAPRSL